MRAKIVSREAGQSLVLIALLMFGIIAFLGLVLDGGGVYANRRQSQDASDAAAFAGVRALALRSDNSATTENSIWITITNFATANRVITTTDVVASFIDASGANLCIINSTCGGVPTAATGVRVTTTLPLQPYFISLFIGKAPIPVQAVAAAQSGAGRVASPVMPMTLPFPCLYDPLNPDACPLEVGKPYTLTGDSQLPGGFQWVDYSGGSSSGDLVNYLSLNYAAAGLPTPTVMADPPDTCVPYPGTPDICQPPNPPSWIPSGPGVKPDQNIQCVLNAWIDLSNWGNCNPGQGGGSVSWGTKPCDSCNTWIVPVFDQKYGTGSGAKYHVIFLAVFQLTGYWFGNGTNQCNWAGAPNHVNCKNGLPTDPNTGWELNSCLNAGQVCILGKFLRKVENMQIIPGECNKNGLDVCGFGLSQ